MYDEAIKLYEEARDMFVQVCLFVVVLNTVISAVAPLLLPCCTAKCYSKACYKCRLPQATLPYAHAVLESRGGRMNKMQKFLFYIT